MSRSRTTGSNGAVLCMVRIFLMLPMDWLVRAFRIERLNLPAQGQHSKCPWTRRRWEAARNEYARGASALRGDRRGPDDMVPVRRDRDILSRSQVDSAVRASRVGVESFRCMQSQTVATHRSCARSRITSATERRRLTVDCNYYCGPRRTRRAAATRQRTCSMSLFASA
jgi:hypothetical protein